jgi:hypothetical protein
MLERNSSPRPRLGGHSSCSPEARSHIEGAFGPYMECAGRAKRRRRFDSAPPNPLWMRFSTSPFDPKRRGANGARAEPSRAPIAPIGFIDQTGCVQHMTGPFPLPIASRQPMDLSLNKRDKPFQRIGVSPTPRLQQHCDVRVRGHSTAAPSMSHSIVT